VAELRRVYETVWGSALDPRNFHRKVTGTPGFLQPTEGTTTRDGGRPAQLYRVGRLSLLFPPMLRKEPVLSSDGAAIGSRRRVVKG
jgi:8-oxo-dGTP diphosphatase